MLHAQEYSKRMIEYFKNGNPSKTEWQMIGYLIWHQNDQMEFMEGEPEFEEHTVTLSNLDREILSAKEFNELYMDEAEREEREEYERLKEKFDPAGKLE